MDVSQYKAEFISEAHDHLDTLNAALLELEKDPTSKETINKIFRAFHTLKGNSALMGFTKIAEVAHGLEDVLARIRDGALRVNKEIMDLLFHGVDLLETAIADLGESSEEHIDAEEILAELKGVLGKKEEVTIVTIPERLQLSESDRREVEAAQQQWENVFRIIVVLEPEMELKNAKALIIVKKISSLSRIIRTTPTLDEIRQGKIGTEIEILLHTREKQETMAELARGVAGIRHAFVLGIDERYVKPKETVLEEKEHAKSEIAKQHSVEAVKQVQAVKVDMTRLDALMNLMGEMLISNIRLQEVSKKQDYQSLAAIVAGIDRLILDLQDKVHEIRMVPIGNVLNRFPRMVRDLAEKEGKQVELVIEGSEIEFDRTVLDQIGEPLVHILRNAVDHGIETPSERLQAGKPEAGTIRLLVRREKNHATVEVVDDGGGIDPQKVKAAVLRKGLATQAEVSKMNDNELQMLIFRAGASTNEVVTEVSGRGVGMDVVMSKTKELGGTVILNSRVGQGTTIKLKLPLTVAIITAMLVAVDRERYAIPLTAVEQIIDLEPSQINTIQGNTVFKYRGAATPLFWLQSLVGHRPKRGGRLNVVVAIKGESLVGLVVDEVIGQQPVLIKGLQDIVKGTRGCAGATILGDGSVALILDIDTLL